MERISLTRGIKPSTICFKMRREIKEKDKCVVCQLFFDKRELDVEHTIPVSIGEEVSNFQIMCKKCHKEKNKFDIIFINFLKKIGLLIKSGFNEYEILDKREIIKEYIKIQKWLRKVQV